MYCDNGLFSMIIQSNQHMSQTVLIKRDLSGKIYAFVDGQIDSNPNDDGWKIVIYKKTLYIKVCRAISDAPFIIDCVAFSLAKEIIPRNRLCIYR